MLPAAFPTGTRYDYVMDTVTCQAACPALGVERGAQRSPDLAPPLAGFTAVTRRVSRAGRLRAGAAGPLRGRDGTERRLPRPPQRWPSLGSLARRRVTPTSVLVVTWPSPCVQRSPPREGTVALRHRLTLLSVT